MIYTDTDSLLFDIQTEDAYKDMAEAIWLYDTSFYPKDHLLYSDQNKKVLGKMRMSALTELSRSLWENLDLGRW